LKILITGGLGYIGSHVTTLLLQNNIDVVVIDNLENSRIQVLDGIKSITGKLPLFRKIDVSNESEMNQLFDEFTDIGGVIHFAAFKSVSESVSEPLKYYNNNLGGLQQLLKQIVTRSIPLIFSSSCTVYGQSETLPIREDEPLKPATSPYGSTKKIGEQIIEDCCKAYPDFKAILLRYFNPIGAHFSAKIGEYPVGVPQNLVPYLTQTVRGIRPVLKVFGSSYDTPDGSCIRDYIHVMDLAQAHIESLDYLLKKKNVEACEVYNVGTGNGVSVLELIESFESATGKKVPFELSDPRPGDTVSAYADPSKIETNIGWKARYSLEESLYSAWKWEENIKN
jgi:UDP-glucose 4-epimerase